MLRNKEGIELSLGLLIKRFYLRVNIIVINKTLDILIDIRLLVSAANKFIILKSSRVATSNIIIGQLNNLKAKIVRI